jgi:hypothetical protein
MPKSLILSISTCTIKTHAIFWNRRNLISSKYIGRSRLFNNGSNTVESGRGNGLHKHNWIDGSCNGWDLTFSPITEGFKDQIYQRHFSWNGFNIFGQHIFVARLWNFVEKFAHHNRQFFWFYPSSYYPII